MGLATLTLAGLTSRRRQSDGSRAPGGLDGLDLDPAPGKLTALLGPPGSGKSALIRAVAGFDHPAGAIFLDGSDIGRTKPHRRGFGVVLQPDALFPHLTLAENVAYPLHIRGAPSGGGNSLVAETLELVQLDGLGDRRPHQVTAAQRQRAMLARATVFAPSVLLLDEPFSDQGPAERPALIASLRRIHLLLGATTTLLATAIGADALAVADRVAVLRSGIVEQHAEPEDVFDNPRNGFVASLLGETNRLPGRIAAVEDSQAMVRLDCGPVVEALPAASLQRGDSCVLTLRPDRIAIVPASAAEMGGHAVDATVIDVQFMGDSYRLRLLIGSGTEILVRRPAGAGLRGLTVGDTGAIAWQAHHAHAFPAAQEGSAPF